MPTAGIDSHKDTLAGNPPPGNGTSKSTAGIDSHKDTLAGCVIDPTGRSIERRTFSNTPAGYRRTAAWLQAHDVGRVGIEGSGSYGRPLALFLISVGCEVVEVPPQMTAQTRKQQRNRSKSDQIDALAIARIAARKDDLPVPRPQDALEDLRALVFYRRELVESRTAEVNRLHADLTLLCPGYHNLLRSGLLSPKALARAAKLITRDRTTRADIARRRIRRVRRLLRQVRKLDTQITRLVAALGTSLTDIYGIGNLTAAEIIAEVGDAARYPTKARFAMANGTAPIEASSGRITRHRLNRGGNRQLNRALHNAAITPIARPGTEGRCYYERLLQRGKTKKEAIRILKRRISDRVWTHLQPTTTTPQTHQVLT